MANDLKEWLDQARFYSMTGQTKAAEEACRKILKLVPDHPEALVELGRTYYFLTKYDKAIELFEKVIKRFPKNTTARLLLYSACIDSKKMSKALELAHEFRDRPLCPGEELAAYHAFLDACDWSSSDAMLNRIIELALNGQLPIEMTPKLLLTLNTVPGISPETMLAIHRVHGERLSLGESEASCPTMPPSQSRSGRLRIAYLSPDFNDHPVGRFILDILGSHDRSRFEVYCYAHLLRNDGYTVRIRQLADQFIDITQLSVEDLASRIYQDKIDILIDLGGHTANSRIHSMTYKPAPVQITYLGYPNTTGIQAVDFRITDRFAESENGTQYTEELLYMPQSFLCFGTHLTEAERAETIPAIRNGYITFGSFNNVRKYNPDIIALWSRILHQVEDSKLLIKSMFCENEIIRGNLLAEFKRNNIADERICFEPMTPNHATHLLVYNEIDIALDCFPYNGTTTTCDTVWMGVPMITLVGEQHAQRTSYSILKNIGFESLATFSPDDYVAKAVEMANKPEALSFLRKCMPTLIKHSILCQPQPFTRQLEALYVQAWEKKMGPFVFDNAGDSEAQSHGASSPQSPPNQIQGSRAAADDAEQPAAADSTPDNNSMTPAMWTQLVEQVLKEYSENRDDNESLQNLRMLRAAFAQAWLGTEPDQAANTIEQFAEGYHKILLSDLRLEPLIHDEKILVDGMLEMQKHESNYHAMVPLMLYTQPHDLTTLPDPTSVPTWLKETYFEYCEIS